MKYILRELKENDPILKQGFVISKPKLDKVELIRLSKSMSTIDKERELTNALIRQGWTLVEDK